MRNAARNYYTVDRLPENVGDSKTMTLQEMINSHMIIEFVDKDNKTCNGTDSYVQVTKTGENEYVLKVQLSCGEQTDYILETIGCYDVCPNGTCTEEELEEAQKLEYQFKKEVITSVTTYSCPDGYTKKGTNCYKEAGTTTINATPTYFGDSTVVVDALVNSTGSYKVYADPLTKAGSLVCPDGYDSNGKQCYKTYTASATTSSGKYTCPKGYNLAGTMCYKTYAATLSESNSLVCPDGYSLSGSTCYKSYAATYNNGATNWSCPNGGTLSGTNCVYAATYNNGTTNWSCPNGGTLSGTRCILTDSYAATANTTYGNWYVAQTFSVTSTKATYSNDTEKLVYNGMTYKYTCDTISKCPIKAAHYNYTLYKRNSSTTYSCPNGGERNGKTCVIDKSYNASKSTTNGYYSCPNGGNVSGTNCVYAAKATTGTGAYTCPNGGTLNGTTCVLSTQATPNSSSKYTCPDGGTLYGSTCRLEKKATTGKGTTVLYCQYGGSLDGNKCTTYTDGTIPTVYYCPTGYTESGKGSSLKCYKTVSGTKTYYCENSNAELKNGKCYSIVKGSISGYVCPSGYTKNGSKCTKTNTVSIKATAKKSETKSYKYTWSEKKTLDAEGFAKLVETVKA